MANHESISFELPIYKYELTFLSLLRPVEKKKNRNKKARCHLCPGVVMRADVLKSRHYRMNHPGVNSDQMIPIACDDTISVACKSQAPVREKQLLEEDEDEAA
jgi:hypothetical protein